MPKADNGRLCLIFPPLMNRIGDLFVDFERNRLFEFGDFAVFDLMNDKNDADEQRRKNQKPKRDAIQKAEPVDVGKMNLNPLESRNAFREKRLNDIASTIFDGFRGSEAIRPYQGILDVSELSEDAGIDVPEVRSDGEAQAGQNDAKNQAVKIGSLLLLRSVLPVSKLLFQRARQSFDFARQRLDGCDKSRKTLFYVFEHS